MRTTTYEQYRGGLLDALNLQELIDRLSDFLLDSGFGGWSWNPLTGEPEESDSLDALKDAILRALIEGGQLTPEMLEALHGGEPDQATLEAIARMLDEIVQRLVGRTFGDDDRVLHGRPLSPMAPGLPPPPPGPQPLFHIPPP